MMRTLFLGFCLVLFALLVPNGDARAQSNSVTPESSGLKAPRNCTGSFVNPLSDVCWECLAPITLGSVKLYNNSKKDFGNPSSPICACGSPVPRLGLSIGFWEPVRLADVTRTPWCMVNLGGLDLSTGIGFGGQGNMDRGEGGSSLDSQHVHWYIYPLMYWLELLTDFLCLEAASVDIAFVTELDPLWRQDTLALIINPESGLFANIPAQLACAADCTFATADLGRPEMFWCMGCQGSTYPLSGNMTAPDTEAKSSQLAVERYAYKLHRQLVAWGTSGKDARCSKYPMPVMDKRQYRYQMTNPRALTKGKFTCPTTGASNFTWERGIHTPIKAKDHGYLIWRKRNCCVL